ncbi:MAG: VOC family protein, partial [Lachnospiraceae bacterium]|nr:VOC family protein [Lachnospiraceae bacterium]
MKINKIDHIAVNTLDIEESVAFYTRMFGFKEIKRADMGALTLVYL